MYFTNSTLSNKMGLNMNLEAVHIIKGSTSARIGGLAFTLAIALVSWLLSNLPVLSYLGPLTIALVLAIGWRQLFGYPEAIRAGIQLSAKTLLRLTIVLYGLKLNIDTVIRDGLGLLVRGAATIAIAIALMMLLAKWLKADRSLSLLLGVGTGICGAAAIAAVSPVLGAKEEDTSISIGIISVIGTMFAVGYTLLLPLLSLEPGQFAVWAGISLHEIAHVVLAGAPAGEDAMAVALLAKLGRVFLLIPVVFLLMWWFRRKNNKGESGRAKTEFPWFLLGFLLMSVAGSWLARNPGVFADKLFAATQVVTPILFSMAMAGLGMNVDVRKLRGKVLRPLVAVTAASLLLSVLTLLTV